MARPTKLTPQKLETLVEEYIADKDNLMTKEAFCLFAGISKETLWDYKKKPEFRESIKKLELASETMAQKKLLLENKPVGSIFYLKTQFGYSETSRLDITSDGKPLGVVQLPARNPEE